MKPRASCCTASIILLALLCAGCPEDNPKRCDTNAECATKIEEGIVVDGDDGDGDFPANEKTFCHPTKHYCYVGCLDDADCADPKRRMNDGQLELSRCNQQTRHCEAPGGVGDAGADALGDAGADLAMDLQDGEACVTDEQCQSGSCVDSVCCENACQAPCTSCAVAGKLGRCEKVPVGADPRGNCAGSDADCNGACDGAGGCVYPTDEKSCGTAVCSAAQLTNNFCDGAGTCKPGEAGSCGGYLCDGSGSTCKDSCTLATEPDDCDEGFKCVDGHCANPQPLGADCGDNDYACDSGECTDGVCCEVDACPDCQHCAAPDGKCAADAEGAAPTGECPGDASCKAGWCDGAGGCAYHAANTLCKEQCANGVAVESLCSADGKCEDQPAVQCFPYLCAGDVCADSCTSPAQCVTESLCDRSAAHAGGGVCVEPGDVQDATPSTIQSKIDGLDPAPYIRAAAGTYGGLTFSGQDRKIIAAGTVDLKPPGDGPAITVENGAEVTLQGMIIRDAGGTDGDGVVCGGNSTLTVLDSTIKGANEQGIEGYKCDVTLRRNTIEGNQGGGLKLSDGTFTVVNNLITNNGKSGTGGSDLGGVALSSGTVTFVNNTVMDNLAASTKAAGVICSGGELLRNSLLWGNIGASEHLGCSFDHSNVAGEPGSADCQVSADYLPASGTVCIDGGDSAAPGISQIDITRGPRQKGAAVDIGAFEVQ